MFVPSGCPHCVQNVGDTIAMSANFVDATNLADVTQEVAHLALYNDLAVPLLSTLKSEQAVADTQGQSGIGSPVVQDGAPSRSLHEGDTVRHIASGNDDGTGAASSSTSRGDTDGDGGGVSAAAATVPWCVFKRGRGKGVYSPGPAGDFTERDALSSTSGNHPRPGSSLFKLLHVGHGASGPISVGAIHDCSGDCDVLPAAGGGTSASSASDQTRGAPSSSDGGRSVHHILDSESVDCPPWKKSKTTETV